MKKMLIVNIIIIFLFILSGCTKAIDTTFATKNASEIKTLTDKFDKDIPFLLKDNHIPGIVIAVIHKSQLAWVKGYGFSNLEKKTLMKPNTIFQFASISKSVTAWGIMKLVEQGKIHLDDPVTKYIKNWHFPKSNYNEKDATIRRLLNHTAGLNVPFYLGIDPNKKLPSILDSLNGKESGIEPLSITSHPGQFIYSGGGYTLLQLLIENISGESFDRFMDDSILEKIKMNDSSFSYNNIKKNQLATGYDSNEKPLPNYLFTEKAAAGLYSTVYDIANFLLASILGPNNEPAGRNILKSSSISQMFTATDESMRTYGLGYFIYEDPYGKIVSHGGSNRGWSGTFMLRPDKGEGFVLFTNSDNGANLSSYFNNIFSTYFH